VTEPAPSRLARHTDPGGAETERGPAPVAGTDFLTTVARLTRERTVPGWARFSLELNQDQADIRDWVHTFAADVVRPAAAEWTSARRRRGRFIREAAKGRAVRPERW